MALNNTGLNVKIDPNRLPRHVAIIMDGNGRWARKRFLPRTLGHRAGMSSLKEVVKTCDRINIPILTVFAFSTENWKRPWEEVDYLMRLLVEYLHREIDELHQNNVKIRILGDYQAIPKECQAEVQEAIRLTENNSGLIFNIALNYGARIEIIDAVKKITQKIIQGDLEPESIDENLFSQYLYTRGLPDPDLLIRTSGEMRVSNFLLWQIAYTEIVVVDTMWPDFSGNDFLLAIEEYQKRDRKFGGLTNE